MPRGSRLCGIYQCKLILPRPVQVRVPNLDCRVRRMRETFRFLEELPRKGWVWVNITDNETADFKCQNCGFPHIRYEHEIRNKKARARIRVGCVCAQHFTEDFTNPMLRERDLKGRAGRRLRWPTLSWRSSSKGNLYPKEGASRDRSKTRTARRSGCELRIKRDLQT
jgi:hypothetical protein